MHLAFIKAGLLFLPLSLLSSQGISITVKDVNLYKALILFHRNHENTLREAEQSETKQDSIKAGFGLLYTVHVKPSLFH